MGEPQTKLTDDETEKLKLQQVVFPWNVIEKTCLEWTSAPTKEQVACLVDAVYAAFNAMNERHRAISAAQHDNLCCGGCNRIFVRSCHMCERCCIVLHADELSEKHERIHGHKWTEACGAYSCRVNHPEQRIPDKDDYCASVVEIHARMETETP